MMEKGVTQVKRFRQPLEFGKGKDMDSPPRSSGGNETQGFIYFVYVCVCVCVCVLILFLNFTKLY